MNDWYKTASSFLEEEGITGPDMEALTPTKLEMMKEKLEQKFPNTVWTIKEVYEWIRSNFTTQLKPFEGPKDLYHG